MSIMNQAGGREGKDLAADALPVHLLPVLQQLLEGTPDVTASRRLNMSPRTFSRRVAELLEYLGVQTRFQGGAEAVLRGWAPARHGRPRGRQPFTDSSGNVVRSAGANAREGAHRVQDRCQASRQKLGPSERTSPMVHLTSSNASAQMSQSSS